MKRKINLAVIIDPINLSTGAYKSTIRFLSFLQNNYKITIITDSSPSSKKAAFPKTAKIYRMKSKPLFFDRNQWLALSTKKELEEIFLKEKIDIIHTIMPTIASLRSIAVAKKLNLKIIAHSHTQPENFMPYIPKPLWPICRFLFYRYLVYFNKKANIVICPSEFSESLLKEQSPKLKTKVISNGVNIEKFKPLNKKENNLVKILFVGRLDPEKEVPILIEAFKELTKSSNKIMLNIVGKGTGEKKIKNLIKTLKLKKQINLLGRISEKTLIATYQESDIFAFPSIVELEGMVVLEAMASGLPIIVSDSKDSASKFFIKENGFIFKAGNSSDLASKLSILINNKELRKKMGEKSRKIAKEYDIKKSIKKLENIYNTL